MPGTELTDAVNPLEAGLYAAVSLAKGCYMGQETLAKVHNRDAVKQQLWGLRLSQPAHPGSTVTAGQATLYTLDTRLPLPYCDSSASLCARVDLCAHILCCRWEAHRELDERDRDTGWQCLWLGLPALQRGRRPGVAFACKCLHTTTLAGSVCPCVVT